MFDTDNIVPNCLFAPKWLKEIRKEKNNIRIKYYLKKKNKQKEKRKEKEKNYFVAMSQLWSFEKYSNTHSDKKIEKEYIRKRKIEYEYLILFVA